MVAYGCTSEPAQRGYVRSSRCAHCHAEHDASWRRTYHRTMTQEADAEGALLAPFDGERAEYRGWTARMAMREGVPHIAVRGPNGESRDYAVSRTVGSHRYQQYLTKVGESWWRLPWAYHVEEARWFHMNGAFLFADPEDGRPATHAEHDRHVTRWNDNCVFCHNVAPIPRPRSGDDVAQARELFEGLVHAEGSFDTEVAELGIACEACHGPGEAHAAANQNPLRRFLLHFSDDADDTVANPARMESGRQSDVCGRCHGQRLAADIANVLAHGDGFVPGDDLARVSEPLWADTELNGNAVFGARFWPDGSPRLTAYEYQGMLQSRCAQLGDLGCESCHAMHEGDPAGQLRDEDNDAPCITCHASEAASPAHAGTPHSNVACVECHMPRTVYGVLDAHRSHRIQRGNDGCVLCHLGETPAFFAASGRAGLGGGWREGDGLTASVGEQLAFGGDAVERALVAAAYEHDEDSDAVLLAMMEDDPYPAVRRLAWRSLRRRRRLDADGFDPMGDRGARIAQVEALGLSTRRPPSRALRAQTQDVDLEIGE